ncbi:MAG: membrane protein insertase YidC [Gemmatimonadota bacterium]
MSAQNRFVLAVVLMLAVLVGGNLLFPPAPAPEGEPPVADTTVEDPEVVVPQDTEAVAEAPGGPGVGGPSAGISDEPTDPDLPGLTPEAEAPEVVQEDVSTSQLVTVESPLYRFTFSDVGARVRSIELPGFDSFTRSGPVELVGEESQGILGHRLLPEAAADTVELRSVRFQVTPAEGIVLEEGGEPQTLTFRYEHPTEPFAFEVAYTFHPDQYIVHARGRSEGLNRGLVITDLGIGPAFNEADEARERTDLGYVVNHLQQGIQSTSMSDVEGRTVVEGPLLWAATKSSYFTLGLFPREQAGDAAYLGGALVQPAPEMEDRAAVSATQSLESGGVFEYRFYGGPQDYQRLSALGSEFQEVNPPGWRWMRPVLRPIVAGIMWVLTFFHTTLAIGYGWVLILVGILMRVVLFPLNHKAQRAQLRNMAVQPLLKEIQTKYKDQPEKLQKELMKLYKEHGFNPLAGCWPMLLPWPILIALFFVFENTIELRGVPFAWLPDLSAKDPVYVLPVLLAVSMFLMQWISIRTIDDVNPQMKMMMYIMPIMMLVIFANLPSGLNLYYLTANLAMLPQSWWIARERQKMRADGPPTTAKA